MGNTMPSCSNCLLNGLSSVDTASDINVFGGLCDFNKTYNIRVAGPAQAGKTAIIRWIKEGKFTKTTPTEGVEVENVVHGDCNLVLWDSRQHTTDDPCRPHQADIKGIIYVVDSSDPGRLRIANRMLERLSGDLVDANVLLVFATKQDRPGALSLQDVQAQLMLHLIHDKQCGVFGCSGKTGEGINDGLSWLCKQLNHERNSSGILCGCNSMSNTVSG